eukprot:TCALIF_08456-PA protein Name:"Protein of unknown function" AED:0.78 eAED:1.00 QI:0/0/0/0.33/1/1/3/0/224
MGNNVLSRVREYEEEHHLSRSVSTRYINQVIRQPYGYPRQVGSLVYVNRRLLNYAHEFSAASQLYFAGLGFGRTQSLPALNRCVSPLRSMSFECLLHALRVSKAGVEFYYVKITPRSVAMSLNMSRYSRLDKKIQCKRGVSHALEDISTELRRRPTERDVNDDNGDDGLKTKKDDEQEEETVVCSGRKERSVVANRAPSAGHDFMHPFSWSSDRVLQGSTFDPP